MPAECDEANTFPLQRLREMAYSKSMPVDSREVELSEKEKILRWIAAWKIAGPELEKEKRIELRAMTDVEALRRVNLVMNSRARSAREGALFRTTSGLVEQQRIFSKHYARAGE